MSFVLATQTSNSPPYMVKRGWTILGDMMWLRGVVGYWGKSGTGLTGSALTIPKKTACRTRIISNAKNFFACSPHALTLASNFYFKFLSLEHLWTPDGFLTLSLDVSYANYNLYVLWRPLFLIGRAWDNKVFSILKSSKHIITFHRCIDDPRASLPCYGIKRTY